MIAASVSMVPFRDQPKALILAKVSTNPDHFNNIAKTKLDQEYEKAVRLGTRAAWRRYHLILTDYKRNGYQFIDSSRFIKHRTDDQKEKRVRGQASQSSLTSTDFRAIMHKIIAMRLQKGETFLRKELNLNDFPIIQPSQTYSGAAGLEPVVVKSGNIILGGDPGVKFRVSDGIQSWLIDIHHFSSAYDLYQQTSYITPYRIGAFYLTTGTKPIPSSRQTLVSHLPRDLTLVPTMLGGDSSSDEPRYGSITVSYADSGIIETFCFDWDFDVCADLYTVALLKGMLTFGLKPIPDSNRSLEDMFGPPKSAPGYSVKFTQGLLGGGKTHRDHPKNKHPKHKGKDPIPEELKGAGLSKHPKNKGKDPIPDESMGAQPLKVKMVKCKSCMKRHPLPFCKFNGDICIVCSEDRASHPDGKFCSKKDVDLNIQKTVGPTEQIFKELEIAASPPPPDLVVEAPKPYSLLKSFDPKNNSFEVKTERKIMYTHNNNIVAMLRGMHEFRRAWFLDGVGLNIALTLFCHLLFHYMIPVLFWWLPEWVGVCSLLLAFFQTYCQVVTVLGLMFQFDTYDKCVQHYLDRNPGIDPQLFVTGKKILLMPTPEFKTWSYLTVRSADHHFNGANVNPKNDIYMLLQDPDFQKYLIEASKLYDVQMVGNYHSWLYRDQPHFGLEYLLLRILRRFLNFMFMPSTKVFFLKRIAPEMFPDLDLSVRYQFPKMKTEYVKYVYTDSFDYSNATDQRATPMGLGKIKHYDPIICQFLMSVGRDNIVRSEHVTISMALVTECVSSPAILDHSSPIEDIDSKIMFFFKNNHQVNLPMHLNLSENVLDDSMLYTKMYVRMKRFEHNRMARLKCHAPAY